MKQKRSPRGRVLAGIVNCLRETPGAIVSVPRIIEHLWGDDPDGGPEFARNCVELGVWRLRKKGVPIVNHHGRGYQYAEKAA